MLESSDRVDLPRRLVEPSREGARELGSWYWDEVERYTRRVVRVRTDGGEVRLVLGRALTLLRFGEPDLEVAANDVECRYPILGGSLAAQPGGVLTIAQREEQVPILEVTVTGYRPSLAARGSRFHRGLLYTALQAPLHRSVSRRFLARSARRLPREPQ